MEMLPIDPQALVGIVLGTSIVLIPIIGFTIRFALKPLVETYARAKSPENAHVHSLNARVELLERQIAELRAAQTTPAIGDMSLSTPMPELPLPGRTRA